MKKLKIGVIRGGTGIEREVSLASGQEIITQLNPEKYEIVDLIFDAPRELIRKLQTTDIEFAYLALHGKF
jgi:D-alanine-D-alanine ligase